MTTSQKLGLDELMIVNPGPEGTDGFFLGEDGTLYQVQGLNQEEALSESGNFFLGEDGTLYQVEGLAQEEGQEGLGEYFLSDDGVLYRLEGFSEPSAFQLRGQETDVTKDNSRFFLGEDGRLYEVIS